MSQLNDQPAVLARLPQLDSTDTESVRRAMQQTVYVCTYRLYDLDDTNLEAEFLKCTAPDAQPSGLVYYKEEPIVIQQEGSDSETDLTWLDGPLQESHKLFHNPPPPATLTTPWCHIAKEQRRKRKRRK